MRKKIFRGKTMAEVVEIVKREMGKDAIIVSSRQVPLGPVWKVWQSPGIEVIAIAKGSNKEHRPAERELKRDSPPPPPPLEKEEISEKRPVADVASPPLVNEKPPQAPAEQTEENESEPVNPPTKKMATSGSKAVSLRAFQAALRRTASPQKSDDLKEPPAALVSEEITPPAPEPQTPESNEPLELTESPERPRTERMPESQPEDYPSLSLDSPKPKLALDDFTQALNPAAKSGGKNAFAEFLREKGFIPSEKTTPAPLPSDDNHDQSEPTDGKTAAEIPVNAPPPQQISKKDISEAKSPAPPSRSKSRIRLSHSPSSLAASQTPFGFPKTVESVRKHLTEQGVDNTIVDILTRSCADSLSPQTLTNIELVHDHISMQMEGHLHTLATSQIESPRLIVAIGPSGAGKTNLIAKLAAHAVKIRALEPIWISADTIRTGAIAEARVYADLIGIPLLLAYTPEELERTIKDCSSYPLILVDTPASNPWRETSMVELGELLHVIPSRTTFLTVPATLKDADLLQIQAGYGVYNINGLVFTKMDETRSLGNVFNLAWRSQIPLAYFTNGTRLLDDLHRADAKSFVQAILEHHVSAG